MSIEELIREEIDRMPGRSGDFPTVVRRGRRRRSIRHGAAALSVGALATIVLLGINNLSGLDSERAGWHRRDSASAVEARPVSHLPRMIVDSPHFAVVGGSETYTGKWEVTVDGTRAELRVLPADAPNRTREDATADGYPVTDIEVATREGFIAEYDSNRTLLAWGDDDHSAELDIAGDASVARRIAESVTYIDEAEWRELLPADLVLPEERPRAVQEFLDGVILPPGLTVEYLTGRDGFLANAIMSGPELAITVTAEVSCRWIQTWVDATATGDDERAFSAVEALSQAHRWPALADPDLANWKSIITGYAEAMADDGTIGDTPVADSYHSLGCGRYEPPAPFTESDESVVTTTAP